MNASSRVRRVGGGGGGGSGLSGFHGSSVSSMRTTTTTPRAHGNTRRRRDPPGGLGAWVRSSTAPKTRAPRRRPHPRPRTCEQTLRLSRLPPGQRHGERRCGGCDARETLCATMTISGVGIVATSRCVGAQPPPPWRSIRRSLEMWSSVIAIATVSRAFSSSRSRFAILARAWWIRRGRTTDRLRGALFPPFFWFVESRARAASLGSRPL